jgi:hypothetical protein
MITIEIDHVSACGERGEPSWDYEVLPKIATTEAVTAWIQKMDKVVEAFRHTVPCEGSFYAVITRTGCIPGGKLFVTDAQKKIVLEKLVEKLHNTIRLGSNTGQGAFCISLRCQLKMPTYQLALN